MQLQHPLIVLAVTASILTACSVAPTTTPADTTPVAAAPIETTSLLGEPLHRPTLSEDARRTHRANLLEAEANCRRNPNDETAAIWYGRRLAYLGRFNDAVDAYTQALERHPRSYRLLRHRGHRYITLRRFDDAIADLRRADELMRGKPDQTEPDGLPNEAGIPISSTRTNILYHLGLAHYLKGDFESAGRVFARCLDASRNDDNVVSASYWLALSLARSGEREGSDETLESITRDMDVIENHAYHRLLLMFKGERDASEITDGDEGDGVQNATLAYGTAVWRLLNGERGEAMQRFRTIVDNGAWPAFGHIAAEAELAREK